MSILQSLVLCYYNYCPVVWHFIGTEDAKKIERVQYCALKFVYNDFKASYGMLGERSGLLLLYTRRVKLLLIEIYTMYYCISPRYLHNIIIKFDGILITRNNFRLNQPICFTSSYGFKLLSGMVVIRLCDCDARCF